jgi:hypothetical protein
MYDIGFVNRRRLYPLIDPFITAPAPPAQVTTFDAGASGSNITRSNGDKTAEKTGAAAWAQIQSTTSKSSGRKYVEFSIDALANAAPGLSGALWTIAVQKGQTNFDTFHSGGTGDCGFIRADMSSFDGGAAGGVTFTSANKPSFTGAVNDILAWDIDFDVGEARLAYNNTWGSGPVLTWTPGGSWFLSWAGDTNGGGVNPKATIKTAASTQTFSPPSGAVPWD